MNVHEHDKASGYLKGAGPARDIAERLLIAYYTDHHSADSAAYHYSLAEKSLKDLAAAMGFRLVPIGAESEVA